MTQLTEYYKILQRFSSLYAGEGDDELARQAVNAITPLAEKGNTKAQYMIQNKTIVAKLLYVHTQKNNSGSRRFEF